MRFFLLVLTLDGDAPVGEYQKVWQAYSVCNNFNTTVILTSADASQCSILHKCK